MYVTAARAYIYFASFARAALVGDSRQSVLHRASQIFIKILPRIFVYIVYSSFFLL